MLTYNLNIRTNITISGERSLKNVLVTDAQFRAPLAVIRSLGKRNIKITAGSELNSAMGFYSKYCNNRLVYPNPRTNSTEFLRYIRNLVEKNDYDCIIPFHSYTTFLLSKYRDLFSDYTQVPPPNFNVFYNAYDKKRLLNFAMKIGIAVPKTYFADNLDELTYTIDQYPTVIKPSKRHGIQIAICNGKSELKEKYIKMSSKYGPCIVQEYIPNGGEFGVYTLFDLNSEPIGLTVHKRIRSVYSYGGVGTLRKTVKNEEITKTAFKLLKDLRWSGVAMVEFRIDQKDGIPKLMEINPRFWGSLQLSILSGVDFPYLLYQLIMQDHPTPTINYKEDVECRWLGGDITSFFNCSNKSKIIMDFLKFNTNFDVISLRDISPGMKSIFFPVHTSCDEEPRDDSPITDSEKLIL